MQYMQYSEEWFEKNKHTEEWYEIMSEYFRKKKYFKDNLDSISHDIQVINKSLLNNDYDRVREYAGYVENIIERVRKTMEEIPELKTHNVEKSLEESLNEAKAALRKCPRQNTNTTTWSERFYKVESEEEKRARWRYEDSQREYRNMQELLQKPWYY